MCCVNFDANNRMRFYACIIFDAIIRNEKHNASSPNVHKKLFTSKRWAAQMDSWFKTVEYSARNSNSALHSRNTQHSELGRKLALGTPLKCSFGGLVWSVGRLKGIEIAAGVDVGK